jgi:hypothetical protein
LFGTDPDVHGDAAFAEQPFPVGVVGRPYSCDLLRRAVQGPCDLAGQHVDLVAVRERHQDVGAGDPGRFQDARTRGIAVHGSYIEPVLKVAQDLLVDVDHRDVVGLFAGEVIRRGTAHLSGAQNDDFHGTTLLQAAATGGGRQPQSGT